MLHFWITIDYIFVAYLLTYNKTYFFYFKREKNKQKNASWKKNGIKSHNSIEKRINTFIFMCWLYIGWAIQSLTPFFFLRLSLIVCDSTRFEMRIWFITLKWFHSNDSSSRSSGAAIFYIYCCGNYTQRQK